jgi:hypothetical protein
VTGRIGWVILALFLTASVSPAVEDDGYLYLTLGQLGSYPYKDYQKGLMSLYEMTVDQVKIASRKELAEIRVNGELPRR